MTTKPSQNPKSKIQNFKVLLLLLVYLAITLPNLANYPIIEAAQMGIAAPAYKLAETGVYGNDLYRGFYETETLNYEYLPLYPLVVSLFFKLIGLGIWQGRLVSVFCGLLTVVLTYALGRKLFNGRVGLLSASALFLIPLTIANHSAGDMYPGEIPLLDFARILRYDAMVPVWVLSACLVFMTSKPGRSLRSAGFCYLLTGFFVGLATLSHIYGALILVVFGVFLVWEMGMNVFKNPAGYLILIGTVLPLLPWLAYIAQDYPAYQGQQLRHDTRFDFLDVGFYLNNLRWELWRYVKFFGSFRQPVLWPRPGLYLTLLTLITANIHLIRQRQQSSRRFTLLALPLLALTLALLISFKRYTYVILLLPFLALQIGVGLDSVVRGAWHTNRPRFTHHALRTTLILLILVTLTQTAFALSRHWQTGREITPYQTLLEPVRDTIPAGSRILMTHHFWLPFADYEVLALDLAFVLSDPTYGLVDELAMADTIERLDPNYVLVPDWLLKQYEENPAGLPSDAIRQKWREFDTYLQTTCTLSFTGEPSQHYGQLHVYNCLNAENN